MSKAELTEFAKQMKEFQLYGSQRDLSPEMKRIVKNLTCQEHKYLYCPCCKKYDEVEADPIENIRKFMDYIRAEQEKLNPTKKSGPAKRRRPDGMQDDSVSEITDLEKEEILTKYYGDRMNEK